MYPSATTAAPQPQFGAAPTSGIPTNPAYYQAPVPWSSGLCDCCADVNSCCLTFWCPCVAFGRISEIVDQGATSCSANCCIYTLIMCCLGCPCCFSCCYRSRMRQQYNLVEDPCGECVVHCFCEQCAICQEYRELESRGFDLSIGWHRNVDRRNRGIAMAPVVQQGMTR